MPRLRNQARYGALVSRRTTGIALIVLSFALWGGVLALPFVDGPVATRAGLGIGLYGLSYLAFGVGCQRLGSALWPLLKRWVAQLRTGGSHL